MKRLAILGASGHGKVVADIAECVGWQEIVFYDDAWPKLANIRDWVVAGDTRVLINSLKSFDGVFVAIGHNETRVAKLAAFSEHGAPLVSLVHPMATLSRYSVLGVGCVVMPGAVVNVDAHLGQGCIVNTGASIDHDCLLADGVHVSPGASLAGNVTVGENSWIGIGASIRQSIHIGARVVVGAGAVVVNDIPDQCTVVGVPARIVEPKR